MFSGVDFRLRGGVDWVKAKPGADVRIRIRSRVARIRERKPGIRAVGRTTAEQNAACGFTTCGDVCIIVIAEIRCCATTDRKGHDFAVFAENQGFNITLLTG